LHGRIAFIDSPTVVRVRAFKDPDDNSGPVDLSAWSIDTASLDCAPLAAGNYDATISAASRGSAGNDITIQLVGDSGAGVSIVRADTSFVIHYEDGVSTVGDVNTAIGALVGSDALIVVSAAGTVGTVLVDATDNFGPTALTGGATPRISQPQQLVRVNKKFSKKTSVF